MRKFLFPVAFVLGFISIAWADPSAPLSPSVLSHRPLTSVRAIRALTNDEASQSIPVEFQATVTYFRGYRKNLFVQDGSFGVFVKATTTLKLAPGDRVMVKGLTAAGYVPAVYSSEITVLGHAAPPKPVAATWDELIRGKLDSTLVTAQGIVQSADLDAPSADHVPGTTLRVLLDGGYVDAQVDSNDASALNDLLDSEVVITGVAGGKFDGKRQLTGIALHVARLSDIKIVKRAAPSPWSLPATPMDQVLSVYHVKNLTQRVRVEGTVTYFEPGSALVLENGDKSIWVKTASFGPMRLGDRAEATGFPAVSEDFLMLYGSAIRDDGIAAPIRPQHVTWQELADSQRIFDLVSIEGQVKMQAREASQDE